MAALGRILTAMATPMRDDGALDVAQAQRLAAALLQSGSHGIVVAGTTGESPTLEFEEERTLFRELLPVVREHGGSLVAGTGANESAPSVSGDRIAYVHNLFLRRRAPPLRHLDRDRYSHCK